MKRFLAPFSEYTYALFRIMAGYAFMLHGAQKLFAVLGAPGRVPLGSEIGIAGMIELTAGLLIAIGLLTSWMAFIASGEMAVAYFQGHVMPSGILLFPLQNRGEQAFLFCFIFLYIASRGAGIWSIDHRLHRARTEGRRG